MYDPEDDRGVPISTGIPPLVVWATIGCIVLIFIVAGMVLGSAGYGHIWPAENADSHAERGDLQREHAGRPAVDAVHAAVLGELAQRRPRDVGQFARTERGPLARDAAVVGEHGDVPVGVVGRAHVAATVADVTVHDVDRSQRVEERAHRCQHHAQSPCRAREDAQPEHRGDDDDVRIDPAR